MLPGLERERLAQLRRDGEADRVRVGGLGHDLNDLQGVEVRGHRYQVASG